MSSLVSPALQRRFCAAIPHFVLAAFQLLKKYVPARHLKNMQHPEPAECSRALRKESL
jgi:hypothetical protein